MKRRSHSATLAFALILVTLFLPEAWAGGQSAPEAETELQTGIALTWRGSFEEAIPHLLAARGKVVNEYAASFDLALCYTGTSQYRQAIEILKELERTNPTKAEVQNLLAQAYIGDAQSQPALEAVQKAAAIAPTSESLYVLVSDAAMDHQSYSLGLKVVEIGLGHLSDSSRLHYQRALFLSSLDEFDQAKKDFDLAASLAPGSDTAYMAAAQKVVLAGDPQEAVRVVRAALEAGHENYVLLTILGQSLLHSGAVPGQPEFREAQTALEKAVAQRPNYSVLQVAMGELYLLDGRLGDAVVHLERARQLDTGNTAAYSHLATAYQRQGKREQAQKMRAILARLNEAQAEKIHAAPGDRKTSYAAVGLDGR
jgi:tetratricopeptide (TPR) repeat protein